MPEKKIATRIINKHDTETNWNKKTNFIPMEGEIIIYDADKNNTNVRFKIGNGVTNLHSLPFCNTSEVILNSYTPDSTKSFKLMIDDYGTLSVIEN